MAIAVPGMIAIGELGADSVPGGVTRIQAKVFGVTVSSTITILR